jgi:Uncharacterized protein conserved in bacteria
MIKKDIPEEMKNYNRFKGEEIITNGSEVIIGGDKVYELVYDYKDAFDVEKLTQRYSEVLSKYDYIVGDWGHEQLRLKGFYSDSRKKIDKERKISTVQDYLDEYCNFGCAFFILKRLRSKDKPKDQAYIEEKIYKVEKKEKVKNRDTYAKEMRVSKAKHSFTLRQKDVKS